MKNNIIKDAISVVIPVFNEEDNINFVFNELYDNLQVTFEDFQIIFVNDGSNDLTQAVLTKIAKRNDKVLIVNLTKNSGQSFALLAGIEKTIFNKVVMMDGDGQYNPTDIINLYEKLVDNADIVCGYRVKRKDNTLYKIPSIFGNKLVKFLFGIKTNDLGCGLKMGYKNHLESIPFFKNVHRYLPILYFASNKKIVEIKIDHRNRMEGFSKYSSFKAFGVVLELFNLKKNLNNYIKLLKV